MKTIFKLLKYILLAIITLTTITAGAILVKYPSVATEKADCAVVFGAAVWTGNRPSHALYDRTMSGIKLYQDKLVNCLIFSGGQTAGRTHEVDVMSAFAVEAGIPATQIVHDYNGTNTLATITNLRKTKEPTNSKNPQSEQVNSQSEQSNESKELENLEDLEDSEKLKELKKLHNLTPNNSFILVSNDFHLARIALFARRADITNFQLHRANYNYGRYAKEPKFFTREIIAYLYYLFGLNKYN